jgi:hypothetical protein
VLPPPLRPVNHKRLKIQSKFKVWDEPVLSGSLPPDLQGANTTDRRKDRRFEVELHGELRYDAAAFAVQIADISGSGALVFMEDPPPAGSGAELWIEDFGILPIQIMHAGEYFCGVAITNPARYRDRLLGWLRQETILGGPASAVR